MTNKTPALNLSRRSIIAALAALPVAGAVHADPAPTDPLAEVEAALTKLNGALLALAKAHGANIASLRVQVSDGVLTHSSPISGDMIMLAVERGASGGQVTREAAFLPIKGARYD